MKITKKQTIGENLLYVMVWSAIILVPVLNSLMMSELHVSWENVLIAWRKIAPYLIIFIVHNSVIAPRFMLKHKYWKYLITNLTLIIGTFWFVDFYEQHITDSLLFSDLSEDQFIEHRKASFTDLEMYWNVILGFFMSGANTGIKLMYQSIRDEQQMEELKQQNMQAEMDYLKYQINPHFFMNTLNNIHALIDIDTEYAKNAVIELSKMMRYVLYDSGREIISLNKDIQFIQNYIGLMRIRYTNDVDIRVEYPHDLPTQVSIPPLLLIVFVENAFKHGVSYNNPSFIHMHVDYADGKVTGTISNSRHTQKGERHSAGIGLDNVRKRLELIDEEIVRLTDLSVKSKENRMSLSLLSRYAFFAVCVIFTLASLPFIEHEWLWPITLVTGILSLLGLFDLLQSRHAIRRNYPILGNIRYLVEGIRPEIRQYLLESDSDALPFSRAQRSLVYSRAKNQTSEQPFGTLIDVYQSGFEFIGHSMRPAPLTDPASFRVVVGGPQCSQPYSASIFNISAMSFGALSANAVLALNLGARTGGFAHDTGEGSISKYHREHGGDLIWQIASGYFGCRNPDGTFSEERFAANATDPQVKMIELKLSQGAKPGHGGMLPGAKVTPEIAAARGIPVGVDCISPSSHSAFSTPVELMHFIAKLRRLSGGKPTGFKFCVGHPWEWFAIVKAMLVTGITPDFIVVDGAEGGTGAAPVEFVDHVGVPLQEGLLLVHNTLVGVNLRQRIIKFRTSGCTRPEIDRERFLLHALHQGKRNSLRIRRCRKAARCYIHSWLEVSSCFFCRHNLRLQSFTTHAIENINHGKSSLISADPFSVPTSDSNISEHNS